MAREPESPRFVLILGGLFLITYAAYQVGSAWMAAFPPVASTPILAQPYPPPESKITPLEPYPQPELTSIPAYPYPDVDDTGNSAYPYPATGDMEAPADPYPGMDDTDNPAQPYPGTEITSTPAQSYPELEITSTPANATPTLAPTNKDVAPTQVATPTPGVSPTHTPTNLPTITPDDDAYPGPEQTATPDDNPYPGPEGTATPVNTATLDPDDPYPSPEQTATPPPPTPTDIPEQRTPTSTPTQVVLPTLESTPVLITTLPYTESHIILDGSINQAIWLQNESDLGLATSDGIYLVQPFGAEPQILDAGASIASIARIAGDDRIVAGGFDSLIRIWDSADGSFITYWTGHLLGVVRLSNSPIGRFLASASDDATVRIWDDDGTPLHTLRGPITRVVDMAVSSNGQVVAAASNQNVHIWNPQTAELLHIINQPTGWYTAAAFSPNSQVLTTAHDGDRLEFWDTTTWERVDFVPLNAPVQSLVYHPTGRMLAIAYEDGHIQIRDLNYGFFLADLAGHPGITSMAFSPYDDQLLTSSKNGSIRIWDLTPLLNP